MGIFGGCLCGAIRFELTEKLADIQLCHCVDCRKAQGSAFAANIPVKEKSFKWLQGQSHLKIFESSPGKQRCFCETCGSPVFSRNSKVPEVVRVRAGLLEGDLPVRPVANCFAPKKANWFKLDDEIPAFDERYKG